MHKKFRIVCVIGTRPEAVKMAPVVKALRAGETFDCRIVAHRPTSGNGR